MPSIDTARLRELFHYNPENGLFTHKQQPRSKRAGRVAGSVDKSKGGYVRIAIARSNGGYDLFYAHRLAWQYVHGVEPALDIDHRNGVRWDNRIANLREADRSQNQWNYPRPRNNTTGFKGVRVCGTTGRWRAQIRYRGTRLYLGTFDAAELAAAAYQEKARELFGEFVRQEPANSNAAAEAA